MQFWHHSLLFSLLFYSFQHANKNSVRNSGNSEVTAKVTSRRDCNLNYPGKGIWKWSRAGASDVQERKEAAERKKKGALTSKTPQTLGVIRVVALSRTSSLVPACHQLSCSPRDSHSKGWECHQLHVGGRCCQGLLVCCEKCSELHLETEFSSLPGRAV